MTQQPSEFRQSGRLGLLIAGLILIVGIGAGLFIGGTPQQTTSPTDQLRICTDQHVGTASPPTIDRSSAASVYCFEQVGRALLLEEMDIRRAAYELQQFQNVVMLWMVVAITLSGVALAGIQLLIAFKLAAGGIASPDDNSELTIERGKVSLKSSITGLLILVVSLAFFAIFVLWVYRIEQPASASSPSSETTLETGGLGAPPPEPPNELQPAEQSLDGPK